MHSFYVKIFSNVAEINLIPKCTVLKFDTGHSSSVDASLKLLTLQNLLVLGEKIGNVNSTVNCKLPTEYYYS